MKVCSKCKIEKDEGEFGRNKSRSDGLDNYCVTCRKESDKKYRNENKEKIAKARRKNSDYYKKYREKNKDKSKAYKDVYYAINKKRLNDKSAKWAKDNPEKIHQHARRRIAELDEMYLKQILRNHGISKGAINDDMIQLYKEIIKIKRCVKQSKTNNKPK